MGSFEFCAGCNAFESLVYYEIGPKGECRALCGKCRKGRPTVHDVYFNPKDGATQTEENIADPRTGKPIPFHDKPSKVAAMKQANVREAGDRALNDAGREMQDRIKFNERQKYRGK